MNIRIEASDNVFSSIGGLFIGQRILERSGVCVGQYRTFFIHNPYLKSQDLGVHDGVTSLRCHPAVAEGLVTAFDLDLG